MTAQLELLARWSSLVSYAELPAETLLAARYQVLNMFAAARAGARSPEATSIARALEAMALGGGRSTVAGSDRRRGPVDAAFANAAYSMTQDFDDIVWMGHTCHSAVFASLAIAEHEQKNARDFLTAVVVANELAGRVGASAWLGTLNGQMVSFIHLIGAAAATAKIIGLDATRTMHAMAIALMQPGMVLQPGFMRPTSKLLTAASPTATGIQAAYLAREGMTGDPRILEDRRGLWHRFAFVPLPFMLAELGQFWVMQTLTVKSYPGCHYFQTACEALESILGRHGRPRLDTIEKVEIATTSFAREVTRFAGEYAAAHEQIEPVAINFDLAWTAAVMLHAGRLTSEEMNPEWLAKHSAAIRRWRGRIHVHHDPVLTAKVIASARAVPAGRRALKEIRTRDLPVLVRRYRAEYQAPPPRPKDLLFLLAGLVKRRLRPSTEPTPQHAQRTPLNFPNRVVVHFKDGSVETEQVDLPGGSFAAPHVEAALEAKFVRELGEPDARAAFAEGLRLEEATLSDFVGRCLRPTPPCVASRANL